MNYQQKSFITYIRTLQFMQHRLKNKDVLASVYISNKDLLRFFSKYNVINELIYLQKYNEIEIIKDPLLAKEIFKLDQTKGR